MSEHWHNIVVLGKYGSQIYVLNEELETVTTGGTEITWDGHDKFVLKQGSAEHIDRLNINKIDYDIEAGRTGTPVTLDDIIDHCPNSAVSAFAEATKRRREDE